MLEGYFFQGKNTNKLIIALIQAVALILQFLFITKNQFLMSEVQMFQEFTDQNLQSLNQVSSQHKLPKIDHPRSRQAPRSKAQKRKTPPLLPFLKQSAANPITQTETVTQVQHQPDTFAMEIEQRLKLVLENVNQGQDIEENFEDDEQVDFEDLIQQNKQKLKQHKQAKSQVEVKETKAKSKTLKSKNQNSIYQKRMKEYRDVSTQNKFIQKRKEAIAMRQQAIERANQKQKIIKNKQENNQNYNSVSKVSAIKQDLRPKFSGLQRKSEETQPSAPLLNQAKTADLFDNIHNFLENPYKNRAGIETRKSSMQNMKHLQQKIRQINQKLGVKESEEQKSNFQKAVEQKTVLDWKRLEYNRGSNFRCHYDSNFQKQVDKIGSLQQKNSHSLNRFLDHQKALVQLSLLKKISKKPQGKTN